MLYAEASVIMRRLKSMVLQWLPVAKNASAVPMAGNSPIKRVLRSKGYMWMSNSHSTAFYWSHAGQHFEIREEGDWCATPARRHSCNELESCLSFYVLGAASESRARSHALQVVGSAQGQLAIPAIAEGYHFGGL